MDEAVIPGLSMAVIREGTVVYTGAFGMKNAESRAPVTGETVFEAASLSKPVFAYAVMKMVERGGLDLDRPLTEYAPDKIIEKTYLGRPVDDPRFRQITARMVLSHNCGLPNWRRNRPLAFESDPGTGFRYSGEGFVLLQKVVEHVTGKPLDDWMREHVFDPLGMRHSAYIWQSEYDSLSARPHDFMGERHTKRKPSRALSAATLHTTARDYALFTAAVLNGEGLSASTFQQILTPQQVMEERDSMNVDWGLGWGLEFASRDTAFWHWGDNGDFKAFVLGIPRLKMGLVYFANGFHGLSPVSQLTGLALGGRHPSMACSIMRNYRQFGTPGMELVSTLSREGFEAGMRKYRELGEPGSVPEPLINQLGYHFLRKKRFDEAITVFQLNVEAFPQSFNVYDSLGEAYMEKGETGLAVANYEKSLELNPDNQNGRDMLEKLRNR
jgi:CubicO group peptidase (beta-lactamase class C family)